MTGADGERNVPHRVWLQLYDHVLKEVKADMKQQGREDEFVGSKVTIFTAMFYTPPCSSSYGRRSYTPSYGSSHPRKSNGIWRTASR